MADEQNWQPPEWKPEATSQSPFGAAPSQQPPPPSAPPTWTPPPKPGLIPLRPLDLGAILGASFRVLRRNPKATYGTSLIIFGVMSIITTLIVGLVTFGVIARLDTASPEDENTILAGSFGLIALAGLATAALSVIGGAILQGILVLEVARGALGEKLRLRQLWRLAKGRIGALIGWSMLIALAIIVGIGLLVLVIVLLAATLGNVGAGLGVLVGVLGSIGFAVVWVWLSTKLALVPSALMLERTSIRGAVARSWSLTRGYFWRTFGILLLVAFIVNTAVQIVSTPIGFVGGILLALIDPTGSNSQTAIAVTVIVTVISLLVTVALGALAAVIQAATPALLYVDLRIRKEGLDLELIRFIEQRQAGGAEQPDPYRRQTAAATPVPPSEGSPWI